MSKPVSVDEAARVRGGPGEVSGELLRAEANLSPAWFVIDPDSGVKALLAKAIVQEVLKEHGAIFVVQEHGVWPSAEIDGLFERIRQSQGVSASLLDQPAEQVDADEAEYLTCLVACGLYCVWSFGVISLSEDLMVFSDHDEWVAVVSGNPDIRDRVLERVRYAERKATGPKGVVQRMLRRFGPSRRA